MIHIVLVEPQIPQNTGNIARTCAAIGAALHLIKPLGFSLDSKYVKRAGLDYWDDLQLYIHDDIDELFEKYDKEQFFFASTKALKNYSDMDYPDESFLVFGKETKGLDEDILINNKDNCIRIPMLEGIRSLNLSNSAAIVAYEVLRQKGFPGFIKEGRLTRYDW